VKRPHSPEGDLLKPGCALVSLVLVVSVCVYAYQLFVTINPDQGPEGDKGACSMVCVSPCGRTDTDDCY